MTSTIITKNSSTAASVPATGSLTQGELAVNVTDKRLFTKDSGGTVVEVGTNPSTLVLPSGSANGVTYLNGSKVVTSGSALTFDGTNLNLGTGSAGRLNITTASSGTFQTGFYGSNAVDTDFQIRFKTGVTEFGTGTSTPLAFSYGGSEQMRLTSTGLGIGTSSIISGQSGRGNVTINGSSDAFLVLGTGGTRRGGLYTQGTQVTLVNDTATLTLETNGTTRATIDSSGNLGLGVTPSAWSGVKAFQVQNAALWCYANNAYLSANTYSDAVGSKYISTGYATQLTQANGQFQFLTAASGTAGNAITFTQAMTLDASGRLLVGLTSGTSGYNIEAQAGAAGTGIRASNSGGGFVAIEAESNATSNGVVRWTNDLKFISGSERARIDSSGNLLVGTTSTSFGTQGARMLPSGQIQAVSASGNDAFAGYRQTTTAGDSIITGYSNVGGTQVLKFNAMADGNVRIAAGATYGNISDRKYKTNIVDATPKLQDLIQLRVRNFNVSGSEQKAIGFIAQEFETVFPSLVIESVDKDFDGNDLGTTTKGIKESALIPVLVKAIQEQQALITALTARVAQLESN